MADSTRARILAVDDENDILLILRTALKDDYDVSTAQSGPDALAKMEEDIPDLVILDMMMPGMDGMKVLEAIRRNPNTATVPVIFLTGVTDRAKVREALDKGTSYYIVKPFTHHDLMSKVGIALKEAQGAGF